MQADRECVDMKSLPLDGIRHSAGKVLELTLPDPCSVGACPWARSCMLAAQFGFSFKSLELLPFDPPVLNQCPPPRGTQLPRGGQKAPLLFSHVWQQQEVTMKALVGTIGSGIVVASRLDIDTDVVFIGNLGRLIDVCRGENPQSTVVYQVLRVNNIIYLAVRDMGTRTVYWTPGNALEELWTSGCDKNIGNYVVFRGAIGKNTTFVVSQVDAVRQKESMDIVEIKLGRPSTAMRYPTFVQCYFKNISAVDYVECSFVRNVKRVNSGAGQLRVVVPHSFDSDISVVDIVLTKLKALAVERQSSFLLIEPTGTLSILSEIGMDSPWLTIPPFFEELWFVKP